LRQRCAFADLAARRQKLRTRDQSVAIGPPPPPGSASDAPAREPVSGEINKQPWTWYGGGIPQMRAAPALPPKVIRSARGGLGAQGVAPRPQLATAARSVFRFLFVVQKSRVSLYVAQSTRFAPHLERDAAAGCRRSHSTRQARCMHTKLLAVQRVVPHPPAHNPAALRLTTVASDAPWLAKTSVSQFTYDFALWNILLVMHEDGGENSSSLCSSHKFILVILQGD
jgi:hypothetical protein